MRHAQIAAAAIAASALAAGGVLADDVLERRGQHPTLVHLASSSDGVALFPQTILKPGETVQRCVAVTNHGPLPATVLLHGTRGTGTLGEHLRLVVDGGELPAGPVDKQCADFIPDTRPPLYSGALDDYPAAEARAIEDPVRYPVGYQRAYRLSVTLDPAAEPGSLTGQAFHVSGEPTHLPAVVPALELPVPEPPLPTDAPASDPVAPTLDRLRVVRMVLGPRGTLRLVYRSTISGRLHVVGRLQPARSKKRTRTPVRRRVVMRRTTFVHPGRNRLAVRISRRTALKLRAASRRYRLKVRMRLNHRRGPIVQEVTMPPSVVHAIAKRRSASR